jgi:hypothetical protein
MDGLEPPDPLITKLDRGVLRSVKRGSESLEIPGNTGFFLILHPL